MKPKRKNIFVLGMNAFNRMKLENLPHADDYVFHSLLSYEESHGAAKYDVDKIMKKASDALESFDGGIDAIIGFWDFPISIMQTILAKRFGTRATSPQSVLRCEQKHWSRIKQKEVIPELTPEFGAVNPFYENPLAGVSLVYPFWLKPVKSFGGHLGFRIENDEDFEYAITTIRRRIDRFAKPLGRLLSYTDPPPELPEEDPRTCIAEEIIQGRQCTLEGYACEGTIGTHGIIDSHSFPGSSSFSYYQYPSTLPETICRRMKEASRKIMRAMEFTNSVFNIEFFWDEETDRLALLEINPRISQSHADLFEKVDGASNHKVLLDVALGRPPEMPSGEGPHAVAAKFFVRHFKNGIVRSAPGEKEVARLKKEIPGIHVEILAREGCELEDLPYQDSYSYKLAILYFGGDSQQDLQDKFEQAREMLGYEIEDREKDAAREPA